jgi:hypothetical protein
MRQGRVADRATAVAGIDCDVGQIRRVGLPEGDVVTAPFTENAYAIDATARELDRAITDGDGY